ncbi:MAG: YggS family pyridoxal phosphate-dependent enzyme [Amphritea sp.]
MTNIAKNLRIVREQINLASQNAHRSVNDVSLLAVSKTRNADELREAFQTGQRDFGENYLQESLDKIALLSDLDICWHFIGPIQSNKTRPIAESFHWVHSVDRLKIAQRLNDQRPAHLPPLNICLQINISGEESKSGILPERLNEVARGVFAMPNIHLRGLMAIPAATDDPALQRQPFAKMKTLLAQLHEIAPTTACLDTLSMGMSGDMEAAIAEGATIVRIGTAIFGVRDYSK